MIDRTMRKILVVFICLGLIGCATVSAKKVIRLAEQGNAQEQYELATMYENGRGVNKSIDDALKWFRKAAENGHVGSMVDLGWFYQNGQYVKKDVEKAIAFYMKAADQGNSHAQHNLAVLYDEGIDVPEDNELAVKWYKLAAEQGHYAAQLNLAVNYWKGEGVEQNYEKAWNLLNHVRMTSSNRKARWRARGVLDQIKGELGVNSRFGRISYPSWEKLSEKRVR